MRKWGKEIWDVSSNMKTDQGDKRSAQMELDKMIKMSLHFWERIRYA